MIETGPRRKLWELDFLGCQNVKNEYQQGAELDSAEKGLSITWEAGDLGSFRKPRSTRLAAKKMRLVSISTQWFENIVFSSI